MFSRETAQFVCVCVREHRKRVIEFYFKGLANIIIEADKSKICRPIGWTLREELMLQLKFEGCLFASRISSRSGEISLCSIQDSID